MADSTNQSNSGNDAPRSDDGMYHGVPIEQDAADDRSQPRRAASAEFIVTGEVGSEAALREAMDPAHKSLTDALRLSYRVLQIVIVILIILFLGSGVQTVAENQSGVLTRFGQIVQVDDKEALDPGFQFSVWPYPIGEFVLFDVANRTLEIAVPANEPHPGRGVFWPAMRPGDDLEAAVSSSSTSDFLRPGRDGSLITRDGDLAHIQVSATYEIDDPVLYIKTLSNDYHEADRVVRLALQNAAVRVAARTSLQELLEVETATGVKFAIQREAQHLLDQLHVGITIAGVNIPNSSPPFAIRKTFTELGDVREEVRSDNQRSEQKAERMLLETAGDSYPKLRDLINQYEDALDRDDTPLADQLLEQIRLTMASPETYGRVASMIAKARAHKAEVESTLGVEARRVQSLLPTFIKNPDLVIQQRWMEAYATVLNRPDAEAYYIPVGMGSMAINISGSTEVQERRRDDLLARKKAMANAALMGDVTQRALEKSDEMLLSGPGRQLWVDENGNVRGLGQGQN